MQVLVLAVATGGVVLFHITQLARSNLVCITTRSQPTLIITCAPVQPGTGVVLAIAENCRRGVHLEGVKDAFKACKTSLKYRYHIDVLLQNLSVQNSTNFEIYIVDWPWAYACDR